MTLTNVGNAIMKKSIIFIALPICFVFAIMVAACKNTTVTSDDCSYLIETAGYEDIHQETMYLKNITYSNTFYKADISGTVCVPKTQYEQTYTIESQTVTFTQVYGHIWKAGVTIVGLEEPITIYASRAGENYTGGSEQLECEERVISAFEMKKYTHIKYLFFGEINYLKYE